MKCDIKDIYKTKEIEEGVNIDFDEEGSLNKNHGKLINFSIYFIGGFYNQYIIFAYYVLQHWHQLKG